MYTPAALLDIHRGGQSRFALLLAHCGQLSAEELRRELPGFGYPSVLQQLRHMVEAEAYWVDILAGRFSLAGLDDVEGEEYEDRLQQKYPDIAAIEAWRLEVVALTEAYLAGADESELNTPREMETYHGRLVLHPARIILRVVTHVFQHQGQVLAMCRLLGRPGEGGLDFPVRP